MDDTDPFGEKGKRQIRKRANMHEGIAVWCDCCSCEAEPYWAAVAGELGIDLGDFEDEGSDAPQDERPRGGAQ
jgi:hypothetical protein